VRRLRELQSQKVKLAVDLLEFDEPVTKAMWYACGDTLVTDTLDQAKELAYGDKSLRVKVGLQMCPAGGLREVVRPQRVGESCGEVTAFSPVQLSLGGRKLWWRVG
jgi:hypothetical protein